MSVNNGLPLCATLLKWLDFSTLGTEQKPLKCVVSVNIMESLASTGPPPWTYTHTLAHTQTKKFHLLATLSGSWNSPLAEVANIPALFIARLCKSINGYGDEKQWSNPCQGRYRFNSHYWAENGLLTCIFAPARRSVDIPWWTIADQLQWNICGGFTHVFYGFYDAASPSDIISESSPCGSAVRWSCWFRKTKSCVGKYIRVFSPNKQHQRHQYRS